MRTPAAALIALALATAGCFGTSPPARFYVLSPGDEARAAPSAPTGPEGTLGVFPTRVAEYLDRPQIVTFRTETAVELDEFSRWAEPLGTGVSRVLTQELAARLPAWRVVEQSWDPSVPLRARLEVDVTALGWDLRGQARLEAGWAVLSAGGDAVLARGRTVLRRDAAGNGTDAAVEATSRMVGEMAREIAEAVRGLPPPARP
jgi:uncharacterized lipoprotein YmbA